MGENMGGLRDQYLQFATDAASAMSEAHYGEEAFVELAERVSKVLGLAEELATELSMLSEPDLSPLGETMRRLQGDDGVEGQANALADRASNAIGNAELAKPVHAAAKALGRLPLEKVRQALVKSSTQATELVNQVQGVGIAVNITDSLLIGNENTQTPMLLLNEAREEAERKAGEV